MKIGVAGTVESNDCLITVEESDELEIIIESIVMEFFGEQIKKVIVDTLSELKIKTIKVTCNDKGALDYTIKSRLVTAIKRMEG
ncbi:MAG TPA: citrate lyase acyl carrier protein [Bacilli bacterium]|jgi:citrate lyase subunit gamma (acyl carrier protein)|nr:citrate lyase acyl carrier protein [Acholeplasmataceae bacterium]HNZ77616.1 citrate lyase acyl carrier protein [Bacilli bacterium]HOD60497.1 citrate lyase acyl carrier protein [Bacilli bacterium]HOH62235.1 citrate lyase acyl carrier protein [Bacilli bacterium]HPB49293.1 citrate lyase acyl carrier protein [Bacilli bacterium]